MAGETAKQKTDRDLKRGVKKAVLSPFNMSVMAVASAGAAAAGSVGVLIAGGAAYAALVAWDLSSKAFWQKLSGAPARGAAPVSLPRPDQLFDPETREAVARITKARAHITRVMDETPDGVTAHVEPVVASLAELDGRAARLALRADQIARHLAATSADGLRGEIEQLGARAARARDAEAQRQYGEARAMREGQLRNLGDLAAAHDRVLASLARILTTLEGIPTQLVKMRALDAQAADDFSGDVGQELDRINVELGAFEETLETLVEERST